MNYVVLRKFRKTLARDLFIGPRDYQILVLYGISKDLVFMN